MYFDQIAFGGKNFGVVLGRACRKKTLGMETERLRGARVALLRGTVHYIRMSGKFLEGAAGRLG